MNKRLEKIRITGGEFKGREIAVPTVAHAMGSRERLALFNMIGPYLPGSYVLDVYAGSGALGIEAFSRGAQFVLFLDSSDEAVMTIERNLASLGIPPIMGGALKTNILRSAKTATDRYPIIFADPPYDEYEPKMVTCLARMVIDGGILVASTPEEGPEIAGMRKVKTRKYAAAHITVYQKI